ncbi:MAG TPA: di-heme-cytochrome C peroxidase, partial [Rhizomicrobium sp.]
MALASAFLLGAANGQAPPGLDQGWSPQDQAGWYDASQGSRLLPLSWFKALEQPNPSGARFLDDTYISRFRYPMRTTSQGERLPLGFAIDRSDPSDLSWTAFKWRAQQAANEPWLGLNCSACHSAEIIYRQNTLRIDGGPALTDFQSLIENLDLALKETRDDPAKFGRFADSVLGAGATPPDRALLATALDTLIGRRQKLAAMNATATRYGFGRLDAFGHIFNQVSSAAGGAAATANPPDAPVSYPFLWNVPQLARVQWNGISQNMAIPSPIGDPFDAGALARNVGEVTGVFADFEVTADAGLGGYRSSVNVANLAAFEQLLRHLRPPKWPDALFGTPVAALVARGSDLFAGHCRSCHE